MESAIETSSRLLSLPSHASSFCPISQPRSTCHLACSIGSSRLVHRAWCLPCTVHTDHSSNRAFPNRAVPRRLCARTPKHPILYARQPPRSLRLPCHVCHVSLRVVPGPRTPTSHWLHASVHSPAPGRAPPPLCAHFRSFVVPTRQALPANHRPEIANNLSMAEINSPPGRGGLAAAQKPAAFDQ